MPSIKFFFIEKSTLQAVRTRLQERYADASTLPGTRSYHAFIPIDKGIISYKRTAEDESVSGTHSFWKQSSSPSTSLLPKEQDYVSVLYDDYWWIGLVETVDKETSEARVKFMTPHGPRKSFFWPARDDVCWVPQSNILKIISSLSATSHSGRTYQITDSDFQAICSKMP